MLYMGFTTHTDIEMSETTYTIRYLLFSSTAEDTNDIPSCNSRALFIQYFIKKKLLLFLL